MRKVWGWRDDGMTPWGDVEFGSAGVTGATRSYRGAGRAVSLLV